MERLSRFGPEHEREFLDAFGRAVLTWQDAEEALYLLFAGLVRGQDHEVVSAAFHAIQGASSKLAVIDSACSLVVQDTELEGVWRNLHKRIGKRISERNALAHLSVSDEMGEGPQLGRSLFDYRIPRSSYRQYSIEDIRECERKFRLITDQIMTFFESVDEVFRPNGI